MKFFIYPFATAGDKTPIPDTTQPDGSVSYQQGFTSNYQLVYGVDPNAKAIPRFQFNQLINDITTATRAWQTDAIPPFITSVMNGGSPYPYDQYALVRFNDGTGTQIYWSLINNNTTDPTNIANWGVFSTDGWQPGDMKDYAGTTAPFSLVGRWLGCDGSAVSRTTYSRLFNVIGTTWGLGDGSTTFNLPDARRSTCIGSGGTAISGPGNAVGDSGGQEVHTLDVAEMPTHAHNNGFGCTDVATGASGSFLTGYSVTAFTQVEGGNGPHNNMQPSIVVQKLIRY